MKIAGLDLGKRKVSVATFLIRGDGGIRLVNTVTLMTHPTLREKELATLSGLVQRMARNEGWNYAFIEDPLVGRGVRASMEISQTAGAIMSAIAVKETGRVGTPGDPKGSGMGAEKLLKPWVQCEMVNVQTWKKKILGKGNATKHDIRDHIETTYPSYAAQCGDDQDQYDATCIGLFGVRVIQAAQRFSKESGFGDDWESLVNATKEDRE